MKRPLHTIYVRLLGCGLVAATLGSPALAQSTPAKHPPQVTDVAPITTPSGYTIGFQNNVISITDANTNEVLMRLGDGPTTYPCTVDVVTTAVVQNEGIDLHFVMTNNQSTPQPAADLIFSSFTPRAIHELNTTTSFPGSTRPLNLGPTFATNGFQDWPAGSYSPVMVFGDNNHTFGVSLQYPAVEYRHGAHFILESNFPSRPSMSNGWDAIYYLSATSTIPVGATRTYDVSIRVARGSEPWQKTLIPYRDFFRATYGGVKYTRDPRPIFAVSFAQGDQQSPTNPRGFTYPQFRPDRHGYGAWANFIPGNVAQMGYKRVMIWSVSGLYLVNPDNNYPFNIFTGLSNTDYGGTVDALATMPSANLDVGYWWGMSRFVMRTWDTADRVVLDPDNPDHVRLAFAEVDKAVSLGATMIGLDSFDGDNDVWRQYHWLRMLQEHAPTIHFITESFNADFLHTLSPSWINAYQVNGPHALADFLVPGNEIDAATRDDITARQLGRPMTDDEKAANMRQLCAWGYTVLQTDNVPAAPDMLAAQSWNTTVPAALRLSQVPWRDADPLHGQASSTSTPIVVQPPDGGTVVVGSGASGSTTPPTSTPTTPPPPSSVPSTSGGSTGTNGSTSTSSGSGSSSSSQGTYGQFNGSDTALGSSHTGTTGASVGGGGGGGGGVGGGGGGGGSGGGGSGSSAASSGGGLGGLPSAPSRGGGGGGGGGGTAHASSTGSASAAKDPAPPTVIAGSWQVGDPITIMGQEQAMPDNGLIEVPDPRRGVITLSAEMRRQLLNARARLVIQGNGGGQITFSKPFDQHPPTVVTNADTPQTQ